MKIAIIVFTLTLVAAPSSASTIDTSPPDAALCCIGASGFDEFAQVFVASGSALDSLSMYVRTDSEAPLRLRARIYESIGGPTLYESGTFVLPHGDDWALLVAGLSLPVSNGATYTWSLLADAENTGSGVIGLRLGDPIEAGSAWERFDEFWHPIAYDAAFRLTAIDAPPHGVPTPDSLKMMLLGLVVLIAELWRAR